MKRLLIKQKVLVTITTLSIFSLVFVGLFVYFYINKILVENKKSEILAIASEQHDESLSIFKNYQIFVHMLATRSRVEEFLLDKKDNSKRVEISDILNEYIEKDSEYLAIFLLDKDGVAIVSTDTRFIGQDYSFRDYYKNAFKSRSYVDVAIGKTSEEFGYYFSEAVYDIKGNLIGVMVVKAKEDLINKSIIESSVSSSGNTIMLVDNFGVVLSSNNNGNRLKSLGVLTEEEKSKLRDNSKFLGKDIVPLEYNIAQQALRDYFVPIIFKFYCTEHKENAFINISKLDELPFYLVTDIRLDLIGSQVLNTTIVVVSIIAVILIILAFFLYFYILKFLKPLNDFRSYFKLISKGDFSKEIKIESRDEFYELASHVNKMTKDLGDFYKNLDKKVKEQTIEIDKKVKESDDQNKAILNILEDVEKEKVNVEHLANDLEKFKLAVENVSDQIVITDPEGVVIYGNKAVENITGYAPEEVIGKKAGTLWSTPMPKEYYENLWDTIKNKKKSFISEIDNKRKNGEIYTAFISISLVLDKNGNTVYFVAIERDITKEKEVDRAKTEFVSLASHQLRTPLSAINWYSEMLLAGDAGVMNEEQKKYISEIATGNKRMVDLVDDLLNVSRLDMGTFIVEAKMINIIDLAKSVIEESKVLILEKKLIIEENYGSDIPLFSADEKLLRMIFQNLISNAVKYTSPEGKIKVSISKFNFNNNEDIGGEKISEESLVFSVSDSGMGIPIRQQGKIFEKLFRADNAKESETEGTGLGLYVIKSIVNQSGGLVWFKSEENKGSTFFIAFPLSGMKIKKSDIK